MLCVCHLHTQQAQSEPYNIYSIMTDNDSNHLTAELIGQTLEDESLRPADRIVKLALISLFGPDFDTSFTKHLSEDDKAMVRERTTLISAAIGCAAADMRDKYG